MATQMIERPVEQPTADVEARFPGRYLSITTFKRTERALRRRCGSCPTAGGCSH